MATRMHLNAHANALTYIKLNSARYGAEKHRTIRFRSSEPGWLSTARASFRNDERRCRPSRRVTAEQHTALTDITHHLGLALASWLALARAMHRCPGFPRAMHPCDFEENRAAGNNFHNFYLWFSRRQANNSKGPPIRKCRGRSCVVVMRGANVIRGIFERFPDEIPTSTKIFCTSQRNKYKFSIFFHVGSGGVFERFSSLG